MANLLQIHHEDGQGGFLIRESVFQLDDQCPQGKMQWLRHIAFAVGKQLRIL